MFWQHEHGVIFRDALVIVRVVCQREEHPAKEVKRCCSDDGSRDDAVTKLQPRHAHCQKKADANSDEGKERGDHAKDECQDQEGRE